MKETLGLMVCIMAIASIAVGAGESKYDTTTNSAAIDFGPNAWGPVVVKSLFASSDSATATVKFYVKSGDRVTPTVAPALAATVIECVNTDYALTNGDEVIYFHPAADAVDYRAISGATASNVTLSSGISVAGTLANQIYELTQGGEISLGTTAMSEQGDYLFVSATDSPVRIVVDSSTNGSVQATATR